MRSNGVVFRALDSQFRGPRFKTTGWFQGRLSLSFFQDWSSEYFYLFIYLFIAEDMLLQEDLLKLLPMINEANAMSEELDKKVGQQLIQSKGNV